MKNVCRRRRPPLQGCHSKLFRPLLLLSLRCRSQLSLLHSANVEERIGLGKFLSAPFLADAPINMSYSSPTTCTAGWVCTFSNPFYSQCIQGTGTTAPPAPTTTPHPTTTPTTVAPTTTAAPAPGSTAFVKVSGQKFTLNGADYIVAGTNAYWMAQYSNSDIDQAFSDIAAAGLTTLRTWYVFLFTSRTPKQRIHILLQGFQRCYF